jgi:hypothetical protein
LKRLIAFKPDAIRSPLLSLICVAAFEVSTWAVANAQTMLPTDALEKCDDKMLIESWFDKGFVSAPDNTMFGLRPGGGINPSDCVFFEASMRLFLWLTSRRDNLYVFESPTFYKVTNPDGQGERKLVQNGDKRILDVNDNSARVFAPTISQLGPSGFPIRDDEARRHTPARERNRRLENCDESMKYVTPPTCPGEGSGAPTPSRGTPTPGQVCEKILISKDEKIVYYSIEVNNVYAYFMTGEKKNKFMFDQYPTGRIEPNKSGGEESDVKQIEDFAGKPLKDENALAIELKTAWIEISDDADSSEFITTRAGNYSPLCGVVTRV